jgi:hypothetical protein
MVSEYVLDLKKVRNAIYAVTEGKNPWERQLRLEEACAVAHDITEKWKKRDSK